MKTTEIEALFLDIDPTALQAKLEAIGAAKAGEYAYRRRVFDHPDMRLKKDNSWVRLRDEGDQVMLAFKRGRANEGFEEIQFSVGDFEQAGEFLLRIGLKEKSYQENRRIRYVKGDVEFDIDFWPGLKPYLEIEGPSFEAIDAAAREIGLDPGTKKIMNATDLYLLQGIDPDEYARITFEGMVKKGE